MRDAQYREHTTPRAPTFSDDNAPQVTTESEVQSPISPAKAKWKKAAMIARRAGADDRSPSVSGESSGEESESRDGSVQSPTREEREAARRKRAEATAMRKKTAKMMDLQYFLEMVDQKHRYGSNLRKYHNYWKMQDTTQNYFYWLDHGDGKDVELPECSRARLDKEQVRYLSREERLNYLVRINEQGLLVWAKNGELVWTKDELYKDSINGIVPISDPTPKFKYNVPPPDGNDSESSSSEESEDDDEDEDIHDEDDNTAGDEGERYVNEEVRSDLLANGVPI